MSIEVSRISCSFPSQMVQIPQTELQNTTPNLTHVIYQRIFYFHVFPCTHVEGSTYLLTARMWRSGQLSRVSSNFPCWDKVSFYSCQCAADYAGYCLTWLSSEEAVMVVNAEANTLLLTFKTLGRNGKNSSRFGISTLHYNSIFCKLQICRSPKLRSQQEMTMGKAERKRILYDGSNNNNEEDDSAVMVRHGTGHRPSSQNTEAGPCDVGV